MTATNSSSTVGETAASPANPLDRYVGRVVRLWPYVRGAYRRDVLFLLWAMVEQSQDFPHLFWGLHDTPQRHGDLEHFMRYFSEDSGRHLFIVQDVHKDELAGFLWMDDVIAQYRAIGSVYMKPGYRGAPALEAVRLFCDYAFQEYQLESMWGITPWPQAASLITEAGFVRVASLPDFAQVRGIDQDVSIFRLTKERCYGLDV